MTDPSRPPPDYSDVMANSYTKQIGDFDKLTTDAGFTQTQ